MAEPNILAKGPRETTIGTWRDWWPMFVLAIAAIALLSLYVSKFHEGLSGTQGDWGTFGDYLGGVLNPFVGLMTIYLLVRTNRMQMRQLNIQHEQLDAQIRELQAQQEELRETRAEMMRQRHVVDAQNAIMAQQALEQTFFAWLDSYAQMVRELRIVLRANVIGGTYEGHRGLSVLVDQSLSSFDNIVKKKGLNQLFTRRPISSYPWSDVDDIADLLIERWNDVTSTFQDAIAPLFRTLTGILAWIDISPVVDGYAKQQYVDIIRARLSYSELSALILFASTRMPDEMARIRAYRLASDLEGPWMAQLELLVRHSTPELVRRQDP